ncbi:MAG: chemotaxis protein CheW [Alphaproteobacteria bacterium]
MTGEVLTDPVGRPHAMRERLLDERTRRLARPAAEDGPTDAASVLVCALGRSLYGLPLQGVATVARFQRAAALPGQPAAMIGLTGKAGAFFHVFDLGAWLTGTSAVTTPGFIVALRRPPPRVAIRVDRILGVATAIPLTAAEAAPLPASPPAVSAYARSAGTGELDGPLLALVDLDRLVSAETLPPS